MPKYLISSCNGDDEYDPGTVLVVPYTAEAMAPLFDAFWAFEEAVRANKGTKAVVVDFPEARGFRCMGVDDFDFGLEVPGTSDFCCFVAVDSGDGDLVDPDEADEAGYPILSAEIRVLGGDPARLGIELVIDVVGDHVTVETGDVERARLRKLLDDLEDAVEVPEDWVRLGCVNCTRDDCDVITPGRLEQCKAEGWKDVGQVQTYAQSGKTYDYSQDEPPGYSVLDWWTHLGVCPDCAREGEGDA